MTEYGLDFLKEKGFFEKSVNMDDNYYTKDGSEKTVSYLFDSKNRLAYFDDFDVQDIVPILKVLRQRRNFDYYWFWNDGRIYSFRTFGENKHFIFNTQHSRKTDYLKSKKDKLSRFSSSNPTVLFEVKDVILRFYRSLWDLRLKLAKSIKGGFDDRDRILAAQRLLDRLIFIYFIAEKGIIYGIDKRGKHQEVSARDLFKYLIDVSGDFHRLLNTLFFEYLNDSKKNDMPIEGAEGYSLFIPYLNGGLFRERHLTSSGESVGESELEIEGFDWKELIDALNEYNWIIDGYADKEDEDTFGNLTPEILGHIYEKFVISVSELDDIDVDDLKTTKEGELKKGNKKIGAYYTPEVITSYIAENTIFPFAMDKLELGGKYENFVEFHEAHKDNADTLSRFNDALKDIKVLDPAVGSGAFPMAAADILYDWRRKCGEKLDDYHLRREIIINNLHGVDIMEGAVEICMLRLWLWLIAAVDTGKEIEALPNIDFNIFEGNSLIGYVEKEEFADLKPKKRPKARWDTLTHKQFTMENWGEEGIFKLFQKRNSKIREYRNASGERAERLRKEIRQMTDEFNGLLDGKLLNELQNKGIDIDEDGLLELKPFHWVMQYSDVFEKGGFDVVIGNPPYYTEVRRHKDDFTYPKAFLSNYYHHKMDIWYFFGCRSIDLLKQSGYNGFIVKSNWEANYSGANIRKKMLDDSKILTFIDFNNKKVFEGVSNQVDIYIVKKDKMDDTFLVKYFKVNDTKLELKQIVDSISNNVELPGIDNCNVLLNRGIGSSYITFESSENQEILDFIRNKANFFLNEKEGRGYKYHSQGIVAPQDYVTEKHLEHINCAEIGDGIFILSNEEYKSLKLHKNELNLIKPYYTSNELGRYFVNKNNQYWVIYTTTKDIKKIESYPNIKRHLDKYCDIITSDNKPYGLHRARKQTLFEHESIISIRKAAKRPSFTYTDFPTYVSQTFVVIQCSELDLKYLTGVLNSKLIWYWLKNKSGGQGNNIQVDQMPISEIPLIKLKNTKYFSNVVEYLILLNNQHADDALISFLDFNILDSLIYELYFGDALKTNLKAFVIKKLHPLPENLSDEKKLHIVENVITALKGDEEIQAQIERIKAHPWVRVVEGEE